MRESLVTMLFPSFISELGNGAQFPAYAISKSCGGKDARHMFPQKMIWSCMFSPTAGRSSWTGMFAPSKVARAPIPLSSRTCGDLTVL